MASQPSSYYSRKRELIGDAMSEAQYQLSEQMGVLIDRDDQGVLLQIFTQPIGDRPTAFFEIIQVPRCQLAVNAYYIIIVITTTTIIIL